MLAIAIAQSPPGAHAADPAEARRLFDEGKSLYREGRYLDAADRLTRAFDLDPDPTLLYDAARALERGGDDAGALAKYRPYVDADVEGHDRAPAEQRIGALARTHEQHARAERRPTQLRPAPIVPKDERPQPSPRIEKSGSSPVPWIVAGLGLAGVGAGAALGLIAKNVSSTAANDPVQLSSSRTKDDSERYALCANVAFAAGGALAAIGIVWGLFARGSETDVAPSASGRGWAVSGRF
jgi:hypothetical protein